MLLHTWKRHSNITQLSVRILPQVFSTCGDPSRPGIPTGWGYPVWRAFPMRDLF